ncbi:MAG: hypothetical protein ABH843_00775 [Candidatus Omnitrophota bacterium]
MRQIIFNDNIAKRRHKRHLSIQESFTQNDYVFESEREAFFKIREVFSYNSIDEANSWICNKMQNVDISRGLSVLRVFNRKKRESYWERRQTGSFYIVRNGSVISITFLHKLRVEVHKKTDLKNKKIA